MRQTISFTHQLPINKRKARKALLGMIVFVFICIIAWILSQIFWDQFTEWKYSLRLQRNVIKGWPVLVQNWSIYLGIGTVVFMPFIFFMQDPKNPSLALTGNALFINQQMMRNKLIPFTLIEKAEKTPSGYKLYFRDQKAVVAMQKGIFKPFVKYNLENNNFFISNTHTVGDLDEFFSVLSKKLNENR